MKPAELENYAISMVASFNKALELREAPLLKRIAELEARAPIAGPAGKDGANGTDGKDAQFDLEAFTALMVEKVKTLIPPPIPGKDGENGTNGKDGLNGVNGKDGDPGTVGPAGKDAEFDLGAVVAEVVKAVPVPKDGINGRDGKDAEPIDTDAVIKAVVAQIPIPKDGERGSDGKDAEPVDTKSLTDEVVLKVLPLIPPATPGRDGADGKDGRDGTGGPAGADGSHGRDGKDGIDGTDGFSLDDFSIEQLKDGRTVRLKFASGGRVVEKDIRFDVPLYRRTYMREGAYDKDDMVTYHNEVWIAVTDKPTEPPGGMSKQWQLAIRKGRDSKPVKISD